MNDGPVIPSRSFNLATFNARRLWLRDQSTHASCGLALLRDWRPFLLRAHMDLCDLAAKITQQSLARRLEHVVQQERRLDEFFSELSPRRACSSAEQSPPTTATILVELRLFVCVHCTECALRDHKRTPSAESHARFRSARHAVHRTIRIAQRTLWTNWQDLVSALSVLNPRVSASTVEGLYPTPHIYEQMTAQIMATSTTTLSTTR